MIKSWAINSWKWVTIGQDGRNQGRIPVLGPDVHGVKKSGTGWTTKMLDHIPAGSKGSLRVKAEAWMPSLKGELGAVIG